MINMLTNGVIKIASTIIKKFICTDRLHKACVDRMISKIGLHRSQHMMLMFLARHGEYLSQKQISEMTEISPAAVAVTLKKLENGGYIEKRADDTDGRFNRISITDAGREIVEKSREFFSFVDEKMCEGLTAEELATFEKCLDKMGENIKNIDSKGEFL